MRNAPKSRMLIILLLVGICQPLPGIDRKRAQEEVKTIKSRIMSWGLSDLYKIDSEKALEDVILFIYDPVNRLESIKYLNAHRLWMYIGMYDHIMMGSKDTGTFYFIEQLKDITRSIDDAKITLVTYLLHDRSAPGVYGELCADIYTSLFERTPGFFINNLKRRQDWKGIIDELAAGDYKAMNAGLAKLGDTQFNKEVKEYWAECEKRWHKWLR